MTDTRQWVWMALIILVLTGVSAARADSISNQAPSAVPVDVPPIDTGGEVGDPFAGGPPADLGAPSPAGETAGNGSDTSASWTIALIASSNIVAAWLLLVTLLCEVSLARGKAPNLAHNVQIAVWASVPLGLMAALQLVYYAAGGKVGEPGLAGLLPEWDRYVEAARGAQTVLLSAAMRTTLFSVWALILAFVGARRTLRGQWWNALLAVLIWAVLIVVIPVAAGTVKLPEGEAVQPVESLPGLETGGDDYLYPGDE